MKAILNGTILTPNGKIDGKALLYDQTIHAVVDEHEACQQADELIDAQGLYISPGFIDVHIHGYGGDDVSDDDVEGVRRMAAALLKNGVTAFLPTTLTVAWEKLVSICQHIRPLMQESQAGDFRGAQILGVHLEGPFINPAYKGAQNEAYILEPDAERILPLADVIKIITLAPEMRGAQECIQMLCKNTSIAISMGHTGASYEQASDAIDWGVTRATHLFNAMTQLVHRQPGVVGAGLVKDVYTELIADTFHVSKELFPLLTKVKGDHLVLITDALRAAGMPDGEYENGGQRFILKGIECRLTDGTIAGSVLQLNQAVRNLRDYGNVSLSEAICAASLNAAASVGISGFKGSLEPGKDADIVIMDENCRVWKTIVKGVCKYE